MANIKTSLEQSFKIIENILQIKDTLFDTGTTLPLKKRGGRLGLNFENLI